MILDQKKKIWTRQPPIGTEVDYPGCVFAIVPSSNNIYESISMQLGIINGLGANGQAAYGPAGRAFDYGSTGTYYAQHIDLTNYRGIKFGTGDFAVLVVGSFESTTTSGIALSNDASIAPGTRQWRMQPNNDGASASAGAFRFLTYGGTTVAAGATSAFVEGRTYCFLGVRRGSTVELWRNGVLLDSSSGTAQDVSGAEDQEIGFGWNTNTTYQAGGKRYLGAGFDRTIGPAEAKSLSANPWQIFKAPLSSNQFYLPDAVPPSSNTPVPWFY